MTMIMRSMLHVKYNGSYTNTCKIKLFLEWVTHENVCMQQEHAHKHDHTHKRQETTAAARFGIVSFVYSRRRPFHPQRWISFHGSHCIPQREAVNVCEHDRPTGRFYQKLNHYDLPRLIPSSATRPWSSCRCTGMKAEFQSHASAKKFASLTRSIPVVGWGTWFWNGCLCRVIQRWKVRQQRQETAPSSLSCAPRASCGWAIPMHQPSTGPTQASTLTSGMKETGEPTRSSLCAA